MQTFIIHNIISFYDGVFQAFSSPCCRSQSLTSLCKENLFRLATNKIKSSKGLEGPRWDTDQQGPAGQLRRHAWVFSGAVLGECGTEEELLSVSPEPKGQVRALPASTATKCFSLSFVYLKAQKIKFKVYYFVTWLFRDCLLHRTFCFKKAAKTCGLKHGVPAVPSWTQSWRGHYIVAPPGIHPKMFNKEHAERFNWNLP